MVDAFWGEVVDHTYEFGLPHLEVAWLKRVTKQQVRPRLGATAAASLPSPLPAHPRSWISTSALCFSTARGAR